MIDRKVMISATIRLSMIEKLEKLAKEMGISKSAVIDKLIEGASCK